MARKKVHYSFSKGYGNVKNSDAAAVRADIKEVLGINSIATSIGRRRILLIFLLF